MKITDVRLTLIKPGALDKPYWNSIKQTTSKSWDRVELYTDDCIVGMAPAKSGSRSFIEGTIKKKLVGEWLRIAAMASAHHLPMAPHGNAQMGSTCVAAVANGLITENTLRAHVDETMESVDFRDGYIHMDEKPGLGIDWNEKLIKEHRS